ncbi:hypothetical protein ACWD5R_31920 [Streptomyces sp. NPDC002514]|uniref:hypothetical protein n=1 Tax=Streptomyces sp. NPDC001270 TaxID=3364554 RepID=UPI003690FCDC
MTEGHLCWHDAPGACRGPDGVLGSCAGSLAIVDLPTTGVQLEIDIETPEVAPVDAIVLF